MSSINDEDLRRAFNTIDKNGNGSISIDELRAFYIPRVEMLGISTAVAEQEIIALIRRLDLDNGGTITFDEFKKFCST